LQKTRKRNKNEKITGFRIRINDDHMACKKTITRIEIEEEIYDDRNLSATEILSFLSRLEERGF